MKLLTLNCHSWQEEKQLEKIKYLAKVIVEKEFDVIALQEVSQNINSKIEYDNIREDNFGLLLINEIKKLREDNYNLVWDFSHIGYDVYEEGLCIISNHKIVNKESFYISKNEEITCWKSRKIVKATIDYNGKAIDVYSCHLGWFNDEEESFEYQVDRLCSKVLRGNNLSFIMGDFNNNALIRNEGYDLLKQNGLIDTYHLSIEKDSGITVRGSIAGWEDNKEDVRVDIIFTNKNIKVLYSNVIFNGKNKSVISDHFGVEIKVEI